MVGPVWVPRVSPKWAPCGPPGQFCVGPTWAAHNWPYGPPSWDPPVARMGCPCGAQMDPWWGPDGSHVYRPNGPLVAPLANSAWVPWGRPTWGPQGHPHGANMGPRRYCWLGGEGQEQGIMISCTSSPFAIWMNLRIGFWWIYNPMGSLKNFNLVLLWTTVGNYVNMQISAPLLKHLFYSISWQLCIYHLQNCVYTLCFHGQKILSYEYVGI